MHVYVDESKAKSYIVAAILISPGDLVRFRRVLRGLLKPGQSYIHFKSESAARRKLILGAFERLGVRAKIFRSSGLNQVAARAICMDALIEDSLVSNATRLVFELDESVWKSDVRVIRNSLETHDKFSSIEYSHLRKSEEPLLWIADAIAWSYARGGEFKRRALKLIISVRNLTD